MRLNIQLNAMAQKPDFTRSIISKPEPSASSATVSVALVAVALYGQSLGPLFSVHRPCPQEHVPHQRNALPLRVMVALFS